MILHEEQSPANDKLTISIAELREVCELTVKLTELRQNECKHLSIENIAPTIFKNLLDGLREHKRGHEAVHLSDCSIYNEPAYPSGACDCGALNTE